MFAQYLERVSVCVTVTCDMLTSMITSAHLCAYAFIIDLHAHLCRHESVGVHSRHVF